MILPVCGQSALWHSLSSLLERAPTGGWTWMLTCLENWYTLNGQECHRWYLYLALEV